MWSEPRRTKVRSRAADVLEHQRRNARPARHELSQLRDLAAGPDQPIVQHRLARSTSRSALEPSVQALHQLNLYLDGKLVSGFRAQFAQLCAERQSARLAPTSTAVISDQYGKTVRNRASVVFTGAAGIDRATAGRSGAAAPAAKAERTRALNKLPDAAQPSYGALNGSAHAVIDPATNLPWSSRSPRRSRQALSERQATGLTHKEHGVRLAMAAPAFVFRRRERHGRSGRILDSLSTSVLIVDRARAILYLKRRRRKPCSASSRNQARGRPLDELLVGATSAATRSSSALGTARPFRASRAGAAAGERRRQSWIVDCVVAPYEESAAPAVHDRDQRRDSASAHLAREPRC